MTRLVALRALGLGDLLTVVPALRGLRAGFPDAEIWLAAPAALGPLVSRIAAVDRLLAVPSAVRVPPRRLGWPGPPPEVAVNLHGRGPESVVALRAIEPATLWSYGVDGGPPGRDEHEVARWCRLLTWYGCAADPTDLGLGPWRGRRGPFVVHPGAASAERRWPDRRFAAVARELARHGPVVVTGTPDERRLAERVAGDAGLPAGAVAAGRTDLGALADLVSQAGVVVCGDTGVAHLATAYRTPSVVLFGPQPPSRWGPPAGGPHVALWHGPVDPVDRDARPDRPDPALMAITVEEVLAAVAAVRSPAPPGSPRR